MAKISIKRRSESERRDGRAPLYAIIYINNEKIRIPLDLAVKSSEWDSIKECVKGRSKFATDANLIISNVKAKISDVLVRARLSGEMLTKSSFVTLYKLAPEDGSFIAFARRRLESMRQTLQWETQRHHKAVLDKFDKYSRGIDIREITSDYLRGYVVYLRDQLDNNPGTIAKNISVLRVYYYAAMRAGLATVNPFENLRIAKPEPSVVFLTEEELNRLISLYKENSLIENEQSVLRFFLFMTFTAMHISDARALQIEQIFDGEIHYRRIKTRTRVAIPVSIPTAKLIEYYSAGRHKGKLFLNLPTDQAFNRLLKRVCSRVNINKAVSAKAARHTFATLYYKKNSGDIGTLSKLLGHTSVTTTMIYAHIMKDLRVAGVAVFNDFM